MCRSPYGFCGDGPSYCTEDAIWTPECPEDSEASAPTFLQTDEVEPTVSPADQSTSNLGSVNSATNAPTPGLGSVTDAPLPSFHKPSGGGKKPGGKPKPSSGSSGSPQSTDEVTNQPTKNLITQDSAPTNDSGTASPTQSLAEKVYSPTDPEASYFCGLDWEDANTSCAKRCPSSMSEDCDDGYKCFTFTTCTDVQIQETSFGTNPTKPPSEIDNEGGDFGENPLSTIDNEGGDYLALNDPESVRCTGTPCPFVGECRSQYGFCGSQFIYCNDLSSWKLDDCGLSGTDEKGDPVLCDPEVFKCAEGEEVYRDPLHECEFFPCPEDEEEASDITSSSFNLPASSPSEFPELPVPTLPIITQAKPFTFPTEIDLGTNPSTLSNNAIVVVGTGDDIADDGEELSNATGDGRVENSTSKANIDSSGFNPETDALIRDWLESSVDASHGCGHLWALLIMPMLFIFFNVD
jgi:hypothetical protein